MTDEEVLDDGVQEQGQEEERPESVSETATGDEVAEGQQPEDTGSDAGTAEDEPTDRTEAGLLAAMRAERQKRQRVEQERNQYQQLLESLQGQQQQPRQQQQPYGAPRLEDFDDYDTYQRALVRHEAQQELQQFHQRQQAQSALQQFEQRAMARADKPADYMQRIAEVFSDDSLPVSNLVAGAIMGTDDGPDLAYHLHQHPDQLRRLAAMPDWQQGIEIAAIMQRMKATPPPSKAPKPVAPLRGSGDSTPVDLEKVSPDEYRRIRNKQRLAQR